MVMQAPSKELLEGIQKHMRGVIESTVACGMVGADPFRALGKTTVLIEYAKEHGYSFMTTNIDPGHAYGLRDKHDYPHVYTFHELLRSNNAPKELVMDEALSTSNAYFERLSKLSEKGYRLVFRWL
jgi:hypothetical protein